MYTLRYQSNFVYRCLIHEYLVKNTNIFTHIQLILNVPQKLMYAPCLLQVAFNLMICCSKQLMIYLTKSMITHISWIILYYYCYGVHVYLLYIRAF